MRLINLFLTLLFLQICFAQGNIVESFNPKLILTDKGGKIIFCSNSKQIVVNLLGKKIENVDTDSKNELSNSYFVAVDKIIIQATMIAIPENVSKVYGVENLTSEQQMKILRGYMNYEIDYMNDSQRPGIKDIYYAEGNVGLQKHLIWNYFYKNYSKDSDENVESVWGQFCASTLVFDQVLTVSIAISKSSSNINPVMLLKQIVENIEMHKNKCD